MHGSVRNAVVMSVAFFLVFTAFSTAQNYASSGGGSGPVGVLYGTMVVTNLITPVLVSKLGPRASMLFGSFTYALFTAAWIPMSICPPPTEGVEPKCTWGNISLNLLYISSVIIGVGASILWVAQGVFIAKLSATYETDYGEPKDNRLGYFNGMFWMIYQGNQFVGNMLAAALSQAGVENWIIFLTLSIVCLTGCFLFLFLRKPIPTASAYTPIPTAESVKSLTDGDTKTQNPSVTAMMKLWFEPKMGLLVFLFLYSGMSQAYIFGEVPLLVDETECKSSCQAHKFYLMACFGAIDAVCSISFGKVSDTIGRLPIVAICSIAHFGAYGFVYFLAPSLENGTIQIPEEWYYYFLAGLMFGIGDAGFNTQMYAITQAIFSDQKEAAVSNLKFFQSIAMGTMFMFTKTIPYNWKIYLCVGTLVLATLPLFLSKEVRRVNSGLGFYPKQNHLQNDHNNTLNFSRAPTSTDSRSYGVLGQ